MGFDEIGRLDICYTPKTLLHHCTTRIALGRDNRTSARLSCSLEKRSSISGASMARPRVRSNSSNTLSEACCCGVTIVKDALCN